MKYSVFIVCGLCILALFALNVPAKAVINEPFGMSLEQPGPSDWIVEDSIHVYKDRVVLDVTDVQWATFTDTNSMDPVFDVGAHVLQLEPKQEDLRVGDIISYHKGESIIIHRIVEIGFDTQWYAITKGDNNDAPDSDKVRFNQIDRVVIGVLY